MKKVYFTNFFLKLKKINNSNTLTFETNSNVSKLDVKNHFKKLYSIDPKKINVINYREVTGSNKKYRSLKNFIIKKKIIVSF